MSSAIGKPGRHHDLIGKIAILHLWAGNLYGGVETFLVTLARHRHLCPGLVPHFGFCFEGRFSEELRATGAPCHFLGGVRLSRPWTVWMARWRLRQLIDREGFDVVCCHGCWPHAVFAPTVRGRVPLVFWAHDFASGQGPIERRARRTPPDLVLANSRSTAATLVNLFPGVPTEAVGLAVAPPSINGDREELRRTVRCSLSAKERATIIVQVSRMESWKGHTVLLRALGRLREIPDWACWIVGGAQRPHEMAYQAELQALTVAQGLSERVRFLGQRQDVSGVLAAADIHCQPNTGPEPFGIAFVEALYAGLPVVTSAFGGAIETVDDTCGMLVPPGDDVALAGALRQLIDDSVLRAKLATAGPGRAAERCAPAQHLARLNDLLTKLVSSKVTGVTDTISPPTAEMRALQSHGTSGSAIYAMIERAIKARHSSGGVVVDIGCGTGTLFGILRKGFDRYVGVDIVHHEGFPADGEFVQADLDTGRAPLSDGLADVVVSAETIEHVENPRAFFRDLVRLARPGGWVMVSTPNQLSLLSKLSLLLTNQYPAFKEAPGLYPAHLTALLEVDLIRLARECGLVDIATLFSNSGRIPGTPWHWPAWLGFRGRGFSDNLLLIARKAGTV